jgi:exodeoxyribonuclease-1
MVLLVSDSAARPTFLFHDYETFGTHPALDRPAQFAAIRTDDEFNIIGEPEVFYCKPADDYLPQPGAVMVTGITPQEAREKGVNEAEFARRIHDLFTVPNTCVVGYNNIRFDDEVTRNIFIATSTIPMPGAGRTAIHAGICSTSCAPVMPCVLRALTGRKMRKG